MLDVLIHIANIEIQFPTIFYYWQLTGPNEFTHTPHRAAQILGSGFKVIEALGRRIVYPLRSLKTFTVMAFSVHVAKL